jgi:hypothetical protein
MKEQEIFESNQKIGDLPLAILDELNKYRIEAAKMIENGEKESVANLSALITAFRLGAKNSHLLNK